MSKNIIDMSFLKITLRAIIIFIIIITYEEFTKCGEELQYLLSVFVVMVLWNMYDLYFKIIQLEKGNSINDIKEGK